MAKCKILTRKHLRDVHRVAYRRGKMHSCYLRFGGKHGHGKRQLSLLMSTCVDLLLEHYLIDNLKAPNSNAAHSALTQSPTAFDMYFGMNIRSVDKEYVERAAYGIGSGISSLGYDPRNFFINQFFPELVTLNNLVKKRVKEHYMERNYMERNFSPPCCFNQVSVKLYYDGKKCHQHTDLNFNRTHTAPTKNNSQLPGSAVAIVTYGDSKFLEFVRHEVQNSKTSVSKLPAVIRMPQDHLDLILLDPRDEFLGRFNAFWTHRSQLVQPNTGVGMAFMFRVTQMSTVVDHRSGLLQAPKIGGTGKKEKQFDNGWKHIENNWDNYTTSIAATMAKIKEGLAPYINK